MAQNWNEERTQTLVDSVQEGVEVTQDDLVALAETLETSTRSVGSKLRKMGYEVQKASAASQSKWSDEQSDDLVSFLEDNDGDYTYKEIAATFAGGEFSSKAIQGKILSLELTGAVKPAEKVVAARQYTEDQEEVFLEMAGTGASIEAIAKEMGKTIQSVRGKALSYIRTVEGFTMPQQEHSLATDKVDPLSAIESIETKTVDEIAEELGKTARGIKTSLTRRGISCADYDGKKRSEAASRKRDNADEKAA